MPSVSVTARRIKLWLPVLCVLATCAIWAQPISFQPQVLVPTGAGPCTVASGDFNRDGKLDLVIGYCLPVDGGAYPVAGLDLLLGNGDGTFRPKIDLTGLLPAGANGVSPVLAADFNRDGNLDLAVNVGIRNSLPFILLGNGDGTFRPATPAHSPLPDAGESLIIAADFNGDGIPDLLAQPSTLTYASVDCFALVLLGNGDGTFRPASSCLPEPHEGNLNSMAAAGDFNADGKLDILWGITGGSGFQPLYLGNGDGTFQAPLDVGTPGAAVVKPSALADLNRDGKLDVATAGYAELGVRLGNGDGTFKYPQDIPVGFFYDYAYANEGIGTSGGSVFIADFNGDGIPDIANGNAVMAGKGDGTFAAPRYFTVASAPQLSSNFYLALAADVNGDGKPDLIYFAANSLGILLNNSPGSSHGVLGYSAATGLGVLAPDGLGSIYGNSLAVATAVDADTNPPTHLGGISLRVRDVNNAEQLARLIYVSPTQINFVMPATTAPGPASLTIDDGSPNLVEGSLASKVFLTSPALFSADGTGTGVPAATAVRIPTDGSQQAVPVFQCVAGRCSAVPMDLTQGPVYLSLYGTGFRHATKAGCGVGNLSTTTQYVGPHPVYQGLDQINVLIPAATPSGVVNIDCNGYGAPDLLGDTSPVYSNTLQVVIK